MSFATQFSPLFSWADSFKLYFFTTELGATENSSKWLGKHTGKGKKSDWGYSLVFCLGTV